MSKDILNVITKLMFYGSVVPMVIESIFSGTECTLSQVLDSREKRVSTYTKLVEYHNTKNVVTLCVNMPGNVKKNTAAQAFFLEGSALLQSLIENPVFLHFVDEQTGPELYIGTILDSMQLKKKIVEAECVHSWLRMLDIDVVDRELGHISRTQIGYKPQTCFVCGKKAKECCSQQSHSALEIKQAITGYYADMMSHKIGVLASESLVQEAMCTPKPGLVDQNNNGSHKDMNLDLFLKSASTLQPYFEKMCKLGFGCAHIEELRNLGQVAEEAMLKATCGVNTHKGAIFCLGFMTYSYGFCVANNTKPTPENICNCIKSFAKDFAKEVPVAIQKARGLGARGQAINGYEIITKEALPFYQQQSNNNRALVLTLLLILSKNEDSNIINRSNVETLHWAQAKAAELFAQRASAEEIKELDQQFIERNISPGGSADLLSATYFLAHL